MPLEYVGTTAETDPKEEGAVELRRAALTAPRLEMAESDEIPGRDETAALEVLAELAVNALPSLDHGEALAMRLETSRAVPRLTLETADRLETLPARAPPPARDADWLRYVLRLPSALPLRSVGRVAAPSRVGPPSPGRIRLGVSVLPLLSPRRCLRLFCSRTATLLVERPQGAEALREPTDGVAPT